MLMLILLNENTCKIMFSAMIIIKKHTRAHTHRAYRKECAECLFRRFNYLGSLIFFRSNESKICFDKQGDIMDYEKICSLLIFT